MSHLPFVSCFLLVLLVHFAFAREHVYPPGISPTIYEAKKHLGRVGRAPLAVNVKRPEMAHVQAPRNAPNNVFARNSVPEVPDPAPKPVVVNKADSPQQTFPPGVPKPISEPEAEEIIYDDMEEDSEEGEVNEVDSAGAHAPEPKKQEHVRRTSQIVEEKVSAQARTPSVLGASHDMDKNEREHLEKHMEIPLDTSKMSPYELAFHYFKLHDVDSNMKLDGLELMHFLMHYVEHEDGKPPRLYSDQELADTIDHVLATDDRDKDGFISYAEFKISYSRADKDNKNKI